MWRPVDPALKSGARRALRETVRLQADRDGTPCLAPRCKYPGVPIDYNPRRRGQPYNPVSYELDEIVPRSMGGSAVDPSNVRPRHAGCNRAAGAAITNAKRRAKATVPRQLIPDGW